MTENKKQEIQQQIKQLGEKYIYAFWYQKWYARTGTLLLTVASIIIALVMTLEYCDGSFLHFHELRFLIVAIIFYVLFCGGLISYVLVRKLQKRMHQFQTDIYNTSSQEFITIYNQILAAENSDIKVLYIEPNANSDDITILPQKGQWDLKLACQLQDQSFTIGTITMRSKQDFDFFTKHQNLKNQQDNYYRYLALQVPCVTKNLKETWYCYRKPINIKYMVSYDNIYQYNPQSIFGHIGWQSQVLKNINTTQFVPEIELNSSHLNYLLNRFRLTDWSDNSYQFANLSQVDYHRDYPAQIFEIMVHDVRNIILISEWITNSPLLASPRGD